MKPQHWHAPQAFYPADFSSKEWTAWLLDPGSFIQRLKQYGIRNPQVQVISQRWALLPLDERAVLGVGFRQFALVREVLIDSPEGQWMYARTVIPATTLTGGERVLGRLKNRSLGSVLFRNSRWVRSEFELTAVTPSSEWHKKISSHANLNKETVWARRSLFSLNKKTVLLTEIFLPAIATLRK